MSTMLLSVNEAPSSHKNKMPVRLYYCFIVLYSLLSFSPLSRTIIQIVFLFSIVSMVEIARNIEAQIFEIRVNKKSRE